MYWHDALRNERSVLSFALWIFVLIAPGAFARDSVPDFSLSAPGAVALIAGAETSIAVSVKFVGEPFGNVSIGVANLPPGVSATFAPDSLSSNGTVNMAFSMSPGAVPATGSVTIFAVDGSIEHAVSVAFVFPVGVCGCGGPICAASITGQGFTGILPRGGSPAEVADLSCLQTDGPVGFSVSGLPTGVTASFETNPTTGDEELFLSATEAAPLGTFTVSVVENSLTASRSFQIIIVIVDEGPVEGPKCHIGYDIVSQWDGMFEAVLSIDNTGTTPIAAGWTLTWLFANGQTVFQLWNGTVRQAEANVTVQGDANIPAGGSDKGVGFLGTRLPNALNLVPTAFLLNGALCAVN